MQILREFFFWVFNFSKNTYEKFHILTCWYDKSFVQFHGNIPLNFPPIYSLDREMQLDLPLSGAFLKIGNHFLRWNWFVSVNNVPKKWYIQFIYRLISPKCRFCIAKVFSSSKFWTVSLMKHVIKHKPPKLFMKSGRAHSWS